MKRLVTIIAGLPLLFAACAPHERVANTIRLTVLLDSSINPDLIKNVQLIFDTTNGTSPIGAQLSRDINANRLLEFSGIQIRQVARDVDAIVPGGDPDLELVLETVTNPFAGGLVSWSIDVNSTAREKVYTIEARVLDATGNVIGSGKKRVDTGGRAIQFGDDYRSVEIRVACSSCSAPRVDAGEPVVSRPDSGAAVAVDAGETDAGPADAGEPVVSRPDSGAAVAVDAGESDAGADDAGPADAGANGPGANDAGPADAGANDAGPADAGTIQPPDRTVPSFSNLTINPATPERGETVIIVFDVSEPLVADPTVTVGSATATLVAKTQSAYTYSFVVPASSTGTKTVTLIGKDLANNEGRATGSITVDTSAGTLDTTFASVGFATHGNAGGGNGADQGRAVAIDSLGRAVVVGTSKSDAGVSKMAIWRFTAAGALDTSFNSTGFNTHQGFTTGTTVANSVVIRPTTGDIFAAGSTLDSSNVSRVVFWKFTSSGALSWLLAPSSAPSGTGDAKALAVYEPTAASAALLATGCVNKSLGGRDIATWKITPSGGLDDTFGSGGASVLTTNGTTTICGNAIAVNGGTGDITVAGRTATGADPMVGVWRFTQNGSLSTSFGTSGHLSFSRGGTRPIDVATSVAIAGSDVVIGGLTVDTSSGTRAQGPLALLIDRSGKLVTTFGSQGAWQGPMPTGGSRAEVNSVQVDARGRIHLAGSAKMPNPTLGSLATREAAVLWRVTVGGDDDIGLGGVGYAVLPASANSSGDQVLGMVLDGSQRPTFTGLVTDAAGVTDMAIWRTAK